MTNKQLKSIRFPGLPDTYIIPEIDATLTQSGQAADAKTTGDEIAQIKEDFTDISETVNGEYTSNFIVGKNLTANSALQHAIIDDPNACISDHIPVTWGSNQFGFIYTDDPNDTNTYQVWFFDSSNNFLDFYGRTPGVVYRKNLVCPENTAYIIISFKRGFTGVVMDNNLNPVYYTAATEITTTGLVQKIGDINSLGTTEKSSLVGAINEVNEKAGAFEQAFEYTELTDEYTYSDSEITWTDGVLTYNGNHRTGGSYDSYHFCYFEVEEGDVIKTVTSVFRDRCDFFDNTVVSNTDIINFNSYTVPHGVNKVALTRYKNIVSDIILYRKRNVLSITEDALQENIYKAITDSTNMLDSTIINLPSKIYALVGYELNIYFENITEEWEKYKWDVTCLKGVQLERGYRITPVAGDVGSYSLKIKASISDASSKEVSTTLVIVPTSAGTSATKSVIVLGDSTTNNGIAITKLNENFSTDVMSISTLGTRGTAPNNHEGRSGWKLKDYFTVEYIDYTDGRGHVANPFYNPTTQTFDADYYFTNSGIAKPDWFIINMGINDMFSYETGTALDSAIETCIGYVDSMVASVKSVSPSSKIGVCLTIPPNHSQDAFGKAYKNGQTRYRYKKNNTIWVNRLIVEYDNRESEGIYLIPIHTNLDTIYNMGMETLPVNARNTTVTYQSPISNGGVHPVESGYWQIADVYTAFLKAHAED